MHRSSLKSRTRERAAFCLSLIAIAASGCRGDATELRLEPWSSVDQNELEPHSSNADDDRVEDAGLAPVDASPAVQEPNTAADAGQLLTPTGDAGASPPSPPQPPPLPPLLCSRLDPEPILAGQNLSFAIDEFLIAQQGSCETSLLLSGTSDDVFVAWFTYLYDYSYALLGCELAPVPEGGLEVFPLTNTEVAGVEIPAPRIGVDDAEHLIRQYLDALGIWLQYAAGERESFEAFLRWQAGKRVDPEVSGALSSCESP